MVDEKRTRRNTKYADWPEAWKAAHRKLAREKGVQRVPCPRCGMEVGLSRHGTVAVHKQPGGVQWCTEPAKEEGP